MKIVAHRGYSGKYPELSPLAFEKALELPIHGIECDIRLSSDGKVAYKVSFSVDQHIQRSGEGKTFGSYTANATLTGEFKLSALTLKEISRQNQ